MGLLNNEEITAAQFRQQVKTIVSGLNLRQRAKLMVLLIFLENNEDLGQSQGAHSYRQLKALAFRFNKCLYCISCS